MFINDNRYCKTNSTLLLHNTSYLYYDARLIVLFYMFEHIY